MLKKNKKVVVFGVLDTAELAHYYLTHDSDCEVVAFTVSRDYIKEPFFKGLPVVAFEEVEALYNPADYYFFAPMTGRKMNKNREDIYNQARAKGYRFISYISSKATTFDNHVGDNCFILEDNTIQPFATIGNNVVIWSGNFIGHHSTIKDHVFCAPNGVLLGHCVAESYCFIGANSTVREYTTLAEGTLVAMGANIIRNTDAWGVYTGNPAHKKPNAISTDIYT